ncbi:pyridoxal 5'-phosphate synthase lyase subunit PdxS, partial [Candidatus Micrarchaeota archaeon]|nr:pyridoxal 5'-phosphate synthase lyase subunit PdxS [Candidatus Micrarchaeota archaeon]
RSIHHGIDQLNKIKHSKHTKSFETLSKEYHIPIDLLKQTADIGRLPVVNFVAGGIATPADAALCMQLGMDGVFVGSGIFKSSEPEKRARAIVDSVAHFADADKIAKSSEGIGEAMSGLEIDTLETKLSKRGI